MLVGVIPFVFYSAYDSASFYPPATTPLPIAPPQNYLDWAFFKNNDAFSFVCVQRAHPNALDGSVDC